MPRTRNLPAPDKGAAANTALIRHILATTAPDLAELRARVQIRNDLPTGWAADLARHLGLSRSQANELRRFARGERSVPRAGALAWLFAGNGEC